MIDAVIVAWMLLGFIVGYLIPDAVKWFNRTRLAEKVFVPVWNAYYRAVQKILKA